MWLIEKMAQCIAESRGKSAVPMSHTHLHIIYMQILNQGYHVSAQEAIALVD